MKIGNRFNQEVVGSNPDQAVIAQIRQIKSKQKGSKS